MQGGGPKKLPSPVTVAGEAAEMKNRIPIQF
jgi:hypothetical protein